jgi:hypothetical protein
MYAIDALLVGIAFHALKNKFQWKITPRMSFVVLFLVFAFLENYGWPMIHVLDITFTVRNSDIAEVFNLSPNEPVANLFGLGSFEFVTWALQAFLAGYLGERLLRGRTADTPDVMTSGPLTP